MKENGKKCLLAGILLEDKNEADKVQSTFTKVSIIVNAITILARNPYPAVLAFILSSRFSLPLNQSEKNYDILRSNN